MPQTPPLYEQATLQQVTGQTVRPGGYFLTERALELSGIQAPARILDVACGIGASVRLLRQKGLQACGIDASRRMLAAGRRQDSGVPLLLGNGAALPVAHTSLDAVITECALSLMPDLKAAMREITRVLRPGGFLFASDLYLRNPRAARELRRFPLGTCLQGARSQAELYGLVKRCGLTVIIWEDHSERLKQLISQLVGAHGSMQAFWSQSIADEINPFDLQLAIARARPGYYLMIAQKPDRAGNVGKHRSE